VDLFGARSPSLKSVVFWFGESFAIIPNLAKYWAANARKGAGGSGNLFNGTPGGRLIKLEGVDLQGELCSGVDQISGTRSILGLPTEILILGEHRFTILTGVRQTSHFQSAGRLALTEKNMNSGELDVTGIDQALARMENGNYVS
jgi:hypothetical protein